MKPSFIAQKHASTTRRLDPHCGDAERNKIHMLLTVLPNNHHLFNWKYFFFFLFFSIRNKKRQLQTFQWYITVLSLYKWVHYVLKRFLYIIFNIVRTKLFFLRHRWDSKWPLYCGRFHNYFSNILGIYFLCILNLETGFENWEAEDCNSQKHHCLIKEEATKTEILTSTLRLASNLPVL